MLTDFVDLGNPINDPVERLILNSSTIKSMKIISRMNGEWSSLSLPESDSEFFLLVTLTNEEEYLFELDAVAETTDSGLYQPERPDQMMDEFLSTVVEQLKDQLDIKSLR